MANFGLALGCQISEADNSNRGKVIAEGVFGGQHHPIQLPMPDNGALEAKMAELERLYHQR